MKKQGFTMHDICPVALLDTNVIYPLTSRDLLFWFAYYDLYIPKWSSNIFDEWKDVMLRKGIEPEEVHRRISRANTAFPEALVQHYTNLMKSLTLPDHKDIHVLAAAIKANASVIVTNNIKDFPEAYLHSFNLKLKTADGFLTELIEAHPIQAIAAFGEMVLRKKNPPLKESEILARLQKIGLTATANHIQALL